MLGLSKIGRKIFGTTNDRTVKAYRKRVEDIGALEAELQQLSDEALKAKTEDFRTRLAEGATVDDILEEAFAVVRESSVRVLGMRHFDVQMIGGMVLNEGKISEMATGEGKTLMSTLPAYLNAISGAGVHVVTVNEYLAARDAEWMGRLYNALGLTVGVIKNGMKDAERRAAYAADITYGTNNEFGFDYLRDNMKFRLEDMVQRPFNFAIVDEVDSILIDEARTPLIISGPAEDSSEQYKTLNKYIPKLVETDYEIDEKAKTVIFTEEGQQNLEEMLVADGILTDEASLYDIDNVSLLHHSQQALRAHKMFNRDTDYVVKGGKVIIIDEFTGRMMEGRRFGEGLHQALEAKEGVDIQPENQTLASITFQNYFRMYPKLSGMTGTAMTEADEFLEIYKLGVVQIPTNKPIQRDDMDDEVYRTFGEKINAVLLDVKDRNALGQPILVGTTSIEKSELLSRMFTEAGIKHNVLNARHHDQEAQIIAQAGRLGAVTIATNMAGRGTDIQLGGNAEARIADELADFVDTPNYASKSATITAEVQAEREKVRETGGLYVIATERHESRRIDNQLRGRSGRQGDPGASKFFVCMEDDLMRIFGGERLDSMLQKLGLEEGEAIVHPWINKALEKAQTKVEARNFDIRKNLLKFDDVMNDQRKVIYEQRKEFMEEEDLSDTVIDMRHTTVEDTVRRFIPPKAYHAQWDIDGLEKAMQRLFGTGMPVRDWANEDGIADEELIDKIVKVTDEGMARKAAAYGAPIMRQVEKSLLLQVLDQQWKEHLLHMDHLRQGIGLRAYGQRDPLNEYKSEAFSMFENVLDSVRSEVTTYLSHVQIQIPDGADVAAAMGLAPQEQEMQEGRQDPAAVPAGSDQSQATGSGSAQQSVRHSTERLGDEVIPTKVGSRTVDANDPSTWGRVPRNAPCPCGSGKKYKHCHGKLS